MEMEAPFDGLLVLLLFFLSKSPGGQDDHNMDVYHEVKHRLQAPHKVNSLGYPVVRTNGRTVT